MRIGFRMTRLLNLDKVPEFEACKGQKSGIYQGLQ